MNDIQNLLKIVGYTRRQMNPDPDPQTLFPELRDWEMYEKFEDVLGTKEFSRMLDILNKGDIVVIPTPSLLSDHPDKN